MMKKTITMQVLRLCTPLVMALALAACNASNQATPNSQAVFTAAAETAAVRLTEAAVNRPTDAPTATLEPTTAPEPPTATVPPVAVDTPPAAATLPPANTPVATSADVAAFVADINYPDNSLLAPGAAFIKEWRVQNVGTTDWTTAYALVCIDGGKMTCSSDSALTSTVKVGQTVDLKVSLTAPTAPGTYKAYFRMRNAAGQFFKLDSGGDLWVQIVVGDAGTVTATAAATVDLSATPAVTATPESTVEATTAPSATPEATATP